MGAHSLFRNPALLRSVNQRPLYNETSRLFRGMHLRLPIGECNGDAIHQCYMVKEGDDLAQVAQRFGSSKAYLLEINADVLAKDESLVAGMIITVMIPHAAPKLPCTPAPTATLPASSSPSSTPAWDCYTVQPGDMLTDIAIKHKVVPTRLCEWNNLSNCSFLEVGQVLAVPTPTEKGGTLLSCEPMEGVYDCWTNTVDPTNPIVFDDVPGYVGMTWTSAYDKFKAINAFVILPGGPPLIWPGMTVKLPRRRCLPTESTDCVTFDAFQSVNSMSSSGNDFFNFEQIKHLDDNFGWFSHIFSSATNAANTPIVFPTDSTGLNSSFGSKFGCGWINQWCSTNDPGQSYCPQCVSSEGLDSYFCYKVKYNDTIDLLGDTFGVPSQQLCAYNGMKNCSCLSAEGSWLKVPRLASSPPPHA